VEECGLVRFSKKPEDWTGKSLVGKVEQEESDPDSDQLPPKEFLIFQGFLQID
jgi:hypothetical protein